MATNSIVEGFAALLEYDPDASAEENAQSMTASACNVVAGEVTQAVRDTTTDVGEVHVGDWIGLGADGRASHRRLDRRGEQPPAGRLVTPDHELLTIIEGEGSSPANTRRITEFVADEYPATRRRGAPRRSAPLPLLLRRRVSEAAPRRLRQLGDIPVSQLRHVGEKRTAALASIGHRERLRPAHRSTRVATSTAPSASTSRT